jgi:hypothetical protein
LVLGIVRNFITKYFFITPTFNYLIRVLAKKSLSPTCASFMDSTLIKHNSSLIGVRDIECTVPGNMAVMHTALNLIVVT